VLAVAPVGAWPAEPGDVAQPARQRMLARTLRCWWLAAERFVRTDCVEVAPPTFDDDLGLAQRVQDFAVEQFNMPG